MSKEYVSLPMTPPDDASAFPTNGATLDVESQHGLNDEKIEIFRKKEEPSKPVPAAFIIPVWIFFSSSVIVYNKYILDDAKGLGFHYPIFLTTFHMLVAAIGTRLLARYTNFMSGLKDITMTSERWRKNILPIGALFSASLITSNMAYLSLSVSFIQMLKAFTPVAVLLISFAFKLKQASWPLVSIVSVVSFGVAIASYGETQFDSFGFIMQVVAILFESSRLVMIQVLLQDLKMDPLVSLHYFAPVCAAFNFLLMIMYEGIEPLTAFGKVGPTVLFSNAGIAFALNVSTVLLIGSASSLVLTLSGVVKDLLLIFGSIILFGSTITPLQIFGYTIALAGLVLYKLKL